MTVPFHPGPRNNRTPMQQQQMVVQVTEDDFCPCPACGESLFYNQVFKIALIPSPIVGEKQLGTTPHMQCVECGECFPLDPKAFKPLFETKLGDEGGADHV